MDMPVRIWVTGRGDMGEHSSGSWVARPLSNSRITYIETEYTRTDTIDAIIRERDEAVRRLQELEARQ